MCKYYLTCYFIYCPLELLFYMGICGELPLKCSLQDTEHSDEIVTEPAKVNIVQGQIHSLLGLSISSFRKEDVSVFVQRSPSCQHKYQEVNIAVVRKFKYVLCLAILCCIMKGENCAKSFIQHVPIRIKPLIIFYTMLEIGLYKKHSPFANKGSRGGWKMGEGMSLLFACYSCQCHPV